MIRLIVAYDRQGGIAKQGVMPWHIPDDMAYFSAKTKTDGGNILVGSTTFATFKGPLKDRNNYLLTSNKTPVEGVELVHNLDAFLKPYSQSEQHLWVVGGANVYAQIMQAGQADEIYATRIEADFDCNQFFPHISEDFQLQNESDLHEQNGFIYRYQVFTKALSKQQ